MRRKHIHRRSFLRGIGTISIGLPFLEEMLPSTASAAVRKAIPARAFNVFFGLGIPKPIQEDGFAGVLEPLKPLSDKLLILRQVDQVRCDKKGINAHFDGATGSFTAMPADGGAKAGGPSIDQIIRHDLYPQGLPAGMVPSLVAGTYFRRSRVGRYVHSYGLDGTVSATMQETPRQLFDRVFGSIPGNEDPDARRERLKRSVLDSVLDEYKHYLGPNSPLGATSKGRLSDHFDRIREYEQRAFGDQQGGTRGGPRMPARSILPHGGKADPGGEGIDITLEQLTAEWRLLADLYAFAIQTDRARFGAITFLAAGERIRLKGTYQYAGRKIFDFDDANQHRASGAKGCSHEWWHKFNEKKTNEELRAHVHMKMREVSYFLSLLAGPEAREANGKTILENSLFTISTESGDGRHNDTKRELSGVFHAITSAGGRFKTGRMLDLKAEAIDVYNTMLTTMGAKRRLGDAKRKTNLVNQIRA